jgi:hypothetical protein
MAVIVVRISACSGLRRQRALLLFSRLKQKAQKARADYKYR